MPAPMATDLIQLPAQSLRLGMTLPYDVYDAGGKLLYARAMKQGGSAAYNDDLDEPPS